MQSINNQAMFGERFMIDTNQNQTIGEGAFGTVYKAFDKERDCICALKLVTHFFFLTQHRCNPVTSMTTK